MKKSQILRKNWEFQKIIEGKKQIISNNIVLYYKKNNKSLKIGISISKKFLIAVKRNFLRRQIRKIFDENVNFENYPFDIVLIIRKPMIKKTFLAKKNCILEILNKLKDKLLKHGSKKQTKQK